MAERSSPPSRIAGRITAWATAFRLPPRQAAGAGGAAGLLVGLAMSLSMRSSQVISSRYQDLIAAAGLLALWALIGAIAGLTVLAPTSDDAEPAVCDTADAAGGSGPERADRPA